MANHLKSGKYGENLAVDFLNNAGFDILAVNWRFKYWEVDIVAMEENILVFVEVKSRKSDLYGVPSDFVDNKKQQNLIQAAEAYIELNKYVGEIRFDIVSVYLETKKVELIKDAFWSN
ncbi:MAG: YraN family protein [Sphingobacterium composti]